MSIPLQSRWNKPGGWISLAKIFAIVFGLGLFPFLFADTLFAAAKGEYQGTNADLSVTKSVTPSLPGVGDLITYTITLTNNGPITATSVVLTDVLPTQLDFVSANQPGYEPVSGQWVVGTLNNAASATLLLVASVPTDTLGLTIVNTTEGVTLDQTDPVTANNTGSASLRVRSTRLTGRVTDSGTNAPIVAATVTITDTASNVYTTLTAASGGYTFTETIADPLVAGTARVRVQKTGYQSEQVDQNLTVNVDTTLNFQLDTTDLTVTKTDNNRSTVSPGETYTYTISVFNDGNLTATSYVITDTLSPYLNYITDTMGVDYTKSGDNYTWRLTDDIAPNTFSPDFTVRVQVDSSLPSASTSIVNTVRVGTSSPEANTSNNTATDTNTGSGTHNLSITLSVSPSQVRTGENATYTIRVSNTGDASVTSVTVTDTFSQYVDIVSASTTQGTRTFNSTTRLMTANIGTLDADESATVTVVTRVNSVARSNLTVSNTASVRYTFGGTTYTKVSSSASFSLVYSTTLPGTGGIELPKPAETPMSRMFLVAVLSAVVLAILGMAIFVFGLRARMRQSEWADWAVRMGFMFTTAAVIFGMAAWGISSATGNDPVPTLLAQLKSVDKTAATPAAEQDPAWVGMAPDDELDVLPDFPIPEPTDVTPDENGDLPDTSPVNRIVLPSIGIDTVVKYVPYDGFTWLIAGLQQEIAWMGDTSWPGLGGNTGLAGHVSLRNGRDGPFRYLDQLVPNDEITLYTEENVYIYRVRETRLTTDTDFSIIEPTDSPQITLITCVNWDPGTGLYKDRLVVFADLIGVTPVSEISFGGIW